MITFNDIGIFIYASDNGATVRQVVEGCLTYCSHVLVIEDGSQDDTLDKIKDLPILVVQNPYLVGKDESLIRGFSLLQHDNPKAIITLDANGQHNPDDLPRFIQAMKLKPNDLILGARILDHQGRSVHRQFKSYMQDFFVSWAAGQKMIDTQTGFRLLPNKFVGQYIEQASTKNHDLETEMLITAKRKGFGIVAIPIMESTDQVAEALPRGSIFGLVFIKLLSALFNPIGFIKALFQKKPIIKL